MLDECIGCGVGLVGVLSRMCLSGVIGFACGVGVSWLFAWVVKGVGGRGCSNWTEWFIGRSST